MITNSISLRRIVSCGWITWPWVLASTIATVPADTWSPLVGRMPMKVVIFLAYGLHGIHHRHLLGFSCAIDMFTNTACHRLQCRGSGETAHFLISLLPMITVRVAAGHMSNILPYHDQFSTLLLNKPFDGFLPLLLLPLPVQLGVPILVSPRLVLVLVLVLVMMSRPFDAILNGPSQTSSRILFLGCACSPSVSLLLALPTVVVLLLLLLRPGGVLPPLPLPLDPLLLALLQLSLEAPFSLSLPLGLGLSFRGCGSFLGGPSLLLLTPPTSFSITITIPSTPTLTSMVPPPMTIVDGRAQAGARRGRRPIGCTISLGRRQGWLAFVIVIVVVASPSASATSSTFAISPIAAIVISIVISIIVSTSVASAAAAATTFAVPSPSPVAARSTTTTTTPSPSPPPPPPPPIVFGIIVVVRVVREEGVPLVRRADDVLDDLLE